MSARAREGLAALSGLLLFFSFPKFGHGAVAWVALLPLLLSLPGTGGRQACRLGYVAGAVSSLGLLYWTALVVTQYGGLSLPVAIVVMAILCLAVALFPSLFAWLLARWVSAFGPAALLLAPLAWVATEVLRAYTFFRFPWCLLGYSQHAQLAFVQVAAWTAVYGVSFLVALPASVVACAATERRARRRALALAGGALVLGLAWGLGEWRLRRAPQQAGRVAVGIVQASIRQDEKWEAGRLLANVERHVALTRRAAAQGARLVVWPESAVGIPYDADPAVAETLRALTGELGIDLVFGNDDLEPAEPRPRLYVGAKQLTPAGAVPFRYHKVRLVPFGEYVPLAPLFTLGGRFAARMVQQVADFTPGTRFPLGEVDGVRFGAFICYEAIFPDLVRQFARGGAGILVNLTNDAWYGFTSAPHQHLAMAVLRSVETGRYLVRAANTGISAIVDPRGRVLERTPLFEPGVIVREVPATTELTFYARHGDVFGFGCLGAALALTLAARRR